jgi:hypothetical protein
MLARALLALTVAVAAVAFSAPRANAAPTAGPAPSALCLPIVNCDPAAALAKDAAKAAAQATLGALVKWVADGAVAILDRIGKEITASPEPHLNDLWFAKHVKVMQSLAVLIVLPLLLVALISAIIHQDPGRLTRAVAVYLPVAVLSEFVAVQLTQLALTATDELCSAVSTGMGNDVAGAFHNVGVIMQLGDAPTGTVLTGGFLTLVVALLVVVGAVLIWLELLLRSAAIYIAVLFLPLTLAGLVWPTTARWAKRLVEILVALILSKFVVFAVISLAASGLNAAPKDGLAAGLGGAALFLLAGFAPFVVLRLVPVVEANVISHMEGTARAPVMAAGATANQVVRGIVQTASTSSAAGTPGASAASTAGEGAATTGASIVAAKAVGIPGLLEGPADDPARERHAPPTKPNEPTSPGQRES